MRILIDILHPAHVHFFKHFIAEVEGEGGSVLVTARDKDVTLDLLDEYEISYQLLSVQQTGVVGLGREFISRTRRLSSVVRGWKPDVLVGIMGPSVALAGRLLRIPTAVFYDTEMAVQTNRFAYRLATVVCTPDCYYGKVPGRHETYPGYHELAYLHPSRFVAEPEKQRLFNVDVAQPYSVVRFVSWEASHDRAEIALRDEQKREIISTLEKWTQVVVSSEGPLPSDLEDKRLQGPLAEVHHLLAGARVLVGESATMASEAAVLGVPAVFIAKTGRGYTDEQETRYGLVRNLTPGRTGEVPAIVEAMVSEAGQAEAKNARHQLLDDKIDVTAWMLEFVRGLVGST